MIPEDVRELLEGRNFAHLSTLLPDGSPHSVAVWIGTHGDEALELIDQLALRYIGKPFPMRSGDVYLISCARAGSMSLPFEPPPS